MNRGMLVLVCVLRQKINNHTWRSPVRLCAMVSVARTLFISLVLSTVLLKETLAADINYCTDHPNYLGSSHYIASQSCTFGMSSIPYKFESFTVASEVEVTLSNGVKIEINHGLYLAKDSKLIIQFQVEIYAHNATLQAGSWVNGDHLGYKLGKGSGSFANKYGGGGGSNGGNGGDARHTSNPTYMTVHDSYDSPTTPGSGAYFYYNQQSKGSGGAALKLVVKDHLQVDGKISMNGEEGARYYRTYHTYEHYGVGGGAAGSIWIMTRSLGGVGTIAADGGKGGQGANTGYDGGGGGGGRIAVVCATPLQGSARFQGKITASGGLPYRRDSHANAPGSAGIVFEENCRSVSRTVTVASDHGRNNPFGSSDLFRSEKSARVFFDTVVVQDNQRLFLMGPPRTASSGSQYEIVSIERPDTYSSSGAKPARMKLGRNQVLLYNVDTEDTELFRCTQEKNWTGYEQCSTPTSSANKIHVEASVVSMEGNRDFEERSADFFFSSALKSNSFSMETMDGSTLVLPRQVEFTDADIVCNGHIMGLETLLLQGSSSLTFDAYGTVAGERLHNGDQGDILFPGQLYIGSSASLTVLPLQESLTRRRAVQAAYIRIDGTLRFHKLFSLTSKGDLYISATGVIDGNYYGHDWGEGPGGTKKRPSHPHYGVGASHGGHGGYKSLTVSLARYDDTYGDFKFPVELGSGGGTSSCGGSGGSSIIVNATNRFEFDGKISVDGKDGCSSQGAGSGGSILVNATYIRGTGVLSAKGGYSPHGHGGGGRIAVHCSPYKLDSYGPFHVTGEAHGARTSGGNRAGAGTVFTQCGEGGRNRLNISNGEYPRSQSWAYTTASGGKTRESLQLDFISMDSNAILKFPGAPSVRVGTVDRCEQCEIHIEEKQTVSFGNLRAHENIVEQGSFDNPWRSCVEVFESDNDAKSGMYWVRPDKDYPAFQTFCDMERDGGGWTLLISLPRSRSLNGQCDGSLGRWPNASGSMQCEFHSATSDSKKWLHKDPTHCHDGNPEKWWMYKGNLARFKEVREEVTSGLYKSYTKCGNSYNDKDCIDTIRNAFVINPNRPGEGRGDKAWLYNAQKISCYK